MDIIQGTTKKPMKLIISSAFLFSVELEGFEPSSKQGKRMLSTCLALA